MVSFSFNAVLVNFVCEMYCDSMYFLEQAKNLEDNPENQWLRWRYLRASILFSFASFEAFLNSFVRGRVRKGANKTFAEIIDKMKLNWRRNLEIISELTGQKIPKELLVEAKRIASIRNTLTHYSGDTHKIYKKNNPNGINIGNAEKSIQLTRDMIKTLKNMVGEEYPPWLDNEVSWTIR